MVQETVKVLALDDDNHSICFVSPVGYFSNAAEFMKARLLKSHNTNYEVRMLTLIDFEDDIDEDFDVLACEYDPQTLFYRNRDKWTIWNAAFNKLWDMGGLDFYV